MVIMMTNRDIERSYNEMRLTYRNIVQANTDLIDDNKMLKKEIEEKNEVINELLRRIASLEREIELIESDKE